MSGKRLCPVERRHIKATRRFLGKQGQVVTQDGIQQADDATLAALFKAQREVARIGR